MSENLEGQIAEALKAQGITEAAAVATEAAPETEVVEAAENYSDFEKEQMSKGWNPKGPKSAEEWARSEPLYDRIKKQNKQIDTLSRTVNELKQHMAKVDQVAYERAMQDLTKQRNDAIGRGDVEMVNRIDEARSQLKAPEMEPPVNETPQAVLEFAERHKDWMQSKDFDAIEMQNWVFERDAFLARYNLSPEDHIATLEEHLQKKFPSYFKKDERSPSMKVDAVASGYESNVAGNVRSSDKKYTFHDLNSEQKQAAKDFERLGVMKVDEYIKQLKDLGELK